MIWVTCVAGSTSSEVQTLQWDRNVYVIVIIPPPVHHCYIYLFLSPVINFYFTIVIAA